MGHPHLIPVSREPFSLLSVERALAELRCGRMVAVRGGGGSSLLVMAAEAVTNEHLAEIKEQNFAHLRVAMTARRAAAMGLTGGGFRVVTVTPDGPVTKEAILSLVDPLCEAPILPRHLLSWVDADPHSGETAALMLAKNARLLPAAVIADITDPSADDLAAWSLRHNLLCLDAGDVFQYLNTAARHLKAVAQARVPLLNAEDAQVVAFRPDDGGYEHYVVKLGSPDLSGAALTRLHSSCFTGDLLGSLRCDCGDQLRGAIREISQAGGGLLIYLAQEGRGIGLVNKLRAYELQDRGFDTLDANEQLGFDADERVYLPAAQMLRQLGFSRVRLLTNNPDKVAGLARCGITVTERVAHAFPSNQHNEFYLHTKKSRSGHLP